tara:strand:- start:776 stop:1144 length:369 start_codon:yes stop_codon:yes gene_type:complete
MDALDAHAKTGSATQESMQEIIDKYQESLITNIEVEAGKTNADLNIIIRDTRDLRTHLTQERVIMQTLIDNTPFKFPAESKIEFNKRLKKYHQLFELDNCESWGDVRNFLKEAIETDSWEVK